MVTFNESRTHNLGKNFHVISLRLSRQPPLRWRSSGYDGRVSDSALASFHAVIPAGGAGTRLWPLSRSNRPKFLLDLTDSGRTLIQQTWDRLEPLVEPHNIHVVTGAAHAEAVAAQLPELTNLIVEPSPRDSMPAIGLAAAIIAARDSDAIIGSFAADHVIADSGQFDADVRQAVAVAQTGKICTIGITPAAASTAFGYIETGARLEVDGAPSARAVVRFVEKPDATTAKKYVTTGAFLWNAGMFVTRTDVLLNYLADLQPGMRAGLDTIARSWDDGDRSATLASVWPALPKVAIDHAIAEPVADRGGIAVVPGRFDWSDLGDFAALADLTSGDDALFVDATGFVRHLEGKSVTVIGIPDAVVIDTGDALLVTTREHAQRVKEAPAGWQRRGRQDLI